MNKIFNSKIIWYTIPIILTITLFEDINMHRDAWFPMALFAIPYCIVIGILGFIYKYLINRFGMIHKVFEVITKIGFIILVATLYYQILFYFTENVFDLNLFRGRFRYTSVIIQDKIIRIFQILKYSQIIILAVFILNFLIPPNGKKK